MRRLLCILFIYLLCFSHEIITFRSFRMAKMVPRFDVNNQSAEIIGGSLHECYRTCKKGEIKVCKYSLTVMQYTSMSVACKDCPFKLKDCYNRGCITAGGYVRRVTVANHMLPGPSIQVCEGDIVQVEVVNAFASESVTIHWHGLHQKGTPYMDGTPYLTQCPILPHNKFEYKFKADPAGTHIWHSHIGFEEADGLFGNFIVRKANDPLSKYYDYDLLEHVMIIWHWYPAETGSILQSNLHRNSRVFGNALLINGLASEVEYKKNGSVYTTPRAEFVVEHGYRYRFRVSFNSAVYCPVQISVDNHTLLMIASESGSFDSVKVDSFIINGGERYDFVLTANQKPTNYWIRFRGLGSCQNNIVKVSEEAILHYKNAPNDLPFGETSYEKANRDGILLNPVQSMTPNYANNTVITFVELNNTAEVKNISGLPDHIFYFKFSLNTYNAFHSPGPYPQMNDVSFEYPPIPLLTQYNEQTSDMFCTEQFDENKSCIGGFCTCPYVYEVSRNNLVEIVFVDTSIKRRQDHPMHLHGHDFYVVAMETVGLNISFTDIKSLNEAGLIRKKFITAPMKDCISVPSIGYVVIRFRATNPGYWFFHCHVANHAEMGMGFVLKVGEHEEMAQPSKGFPICGDWKPSFD